jgi:putative membrane protein
MIRGYSDHAANERTFLAWLRTSIAVIAFGFVIEKFNLFALTLVNDAALDDAGRAKLERLAGPFPEGAGRAFIIVGIVFIVLATSRFVRTGRLLDDPCNYAYRAQQVSRDRLVFGLQRHETPSMKALTDASKVASRSSALKAGISASVAG